jgi:hypothetical protein
MTTLTREQTMTDVEQLEQVALTMFQALQVAGGYTTLPPKLLEKIDAALEAYRGYAKEGAG